MQKTNNLNIWLGRTAYQLIPDRFFRFGNVPNEIEGRLLKDWNDRMPNWKPDSDGVYRNNYFYGGNLKGIAEKLSYLKGLGFNMIYITPIEESVSYHHYDVGNHLNIDPWLGTWSDFRDLCNKAHLLDILIMVDLVFNHTSIHSRYYQNQLYNDWYKKDENGNQCFWWGFKDLAECNTLNKHYQETMVNVAKLYLSNGADGIRLDLGENFPKEFLYSIQSIKNEFPNTLIVGEMWGLATDKGDNSKIFDGQLDSVMNYPLADAILRWVRWGFDKHFEYYFKRVYKEYPLSVQNVLLNNIGTHDTPTTMTMLAGDMMSTDLFNNHHIWDIESPWLHGEVFDTYGFREYEAENDSLPDEKFQKGKNYTKLAIAIMYFLPGIPTIYQGTEIAETGYKDPFNRKPYAWERDETDLSNFLTCIGQYRKNNFDILSTGHVSLVTISNAILILKRYVDEKKSLILVINRTPDRISIHIPDESSYRVIFGNDISNLEPYGIMIARKG